MKHAWMPASPCGPGCLGAQEPTVHKAIRVLRVTAVVLVVLLSFVSLLVMPLVGRRGRNWITRAIFRSVLVCMGITLVVHGEIPGPGRGALVVNNHTSWLDIVAVNAVRPMRAVAKKDIASWPVLGWLVTAAGSVYVDRENIRTLPGTVTALADTLRGGAMVNVTPEGTTWCGLTHGRFRPALFQAARRPSRGWCSRCTSSTRSRPVAPPTATSWPGSPSAPSTTCWCPPRSPLKTTGPPAWSR
jgi:1-acyl-sn-glycerol-3-phosphate acyltransferase